jgi:SAM-dependent methyltransferase
MDSLDYGMTQTVLHHSLKRWADREGPDKIYWPDFRRLQLERWVWGHCKALPPSARVIDIGSGDIERGWMGAFRYWTVGFHREAVIGDLTRLPFADDSIDVVLCTEVLEHCRDPKGACREIYRVVKPDGLALVSSPFCWPDHRTNEYDDYWRFTEQGYELLLEQFESLSVVPARWTDEAAMLYDLMRRFECFGMRDETSLTTGFMVEARKGKVGHA